jgi:TRAP-type C4-dicarboxylate transport system substrate-binding protein
MNRRLFGIVGLALLGFLTPDRAEAKKPPLTIRVATPFPTGHILADTAFRFKELLEAKTHGRITVDVATSVLNEQTINPQMVSCDPTQRVADIMLTGGQPLQDWAPQYFFFNGPYVIDDYAHFLRVWEGQLGDEARVLINQNSNLVALGTVYRGFRQFTSNEPITGPADLAGLRLRLPPVPDWIAVWSSLGAEPVQVALNQLFVALQTGLADASEGDLTQIQAFNLFEVQSHLTLTNHLVGFGLVLANECFMTSLPRSDERKIEKAMAEASAFGTEQMFARESTILGELQAAGMTVVTPDAAAIRAAAQPAIDALFATRWTVTTWDEVLAQ